MKSLEKNKLAFDSLNAIAVGLSIDSVPSKKAWVRSLGIKSTRLLSDFWPHGKVAESYGIFRTKDGFSERANIIIDGNGKIAFFKIYTLGLFPDIEEIKEALKKWPSNLRGQSQKLTYYEIRISLARNDPEQAGMCTEMSARSS